MDKADETFNGSNSIIAILIEAFNTVNHNLLLTKLEYLGFRCQINIRFQSYHTDRKQFVSIGESNSLCKDVSIAVPTSRINMWTYLDPALHQ